MSNLYIQKFNRAYLSIINSSPDIMSAKARPQNPKPEIKSINLSMKLLNTASTKQSISESKPIRTLNELSNRLKVANKGFNQQSGNAQQTKEWIKDSGINLNNIHYIADQIKKAKPQTKMQREVETWDKFEFQCYHNLTFNDFVHKNQQRVANVAVKLSINNNKNTHLQMLRYNNFNKVNGHINKQTKTISNKNDGENLMSKLQSQIQQSLLIYNSRFVKQLHLTLLNVFPEEKYFLFDILYTQIQFIKYLQENEPNSSHANIRNIIQKATILKIEQFFRKKQSNYMKQHQSNNFLKENYYFDLNSQQQRWGNIYIKQRRGQKHQSGGFFDQLNQFQHQQTIQSYNIVDIKSQHDQNPRDPAFLKMLKIIVLGTLGKDKYRDIVRLFDRPELLDEPWLILCGLGINRKRPEQKQNTKAYNRAVENYSFKYRNIGKCDFYNVAGLLSLGAYSQLFDLYVVLKKQCVLSPDQQIIFIHIFIVLASNPTLFMSMQDQNSKIISKRLQNLLQQMLLKIVEFINSLQRNNKKTFQLYFILLLELLNSLKQKEGKNTYKQMIATLGTKFTLSIEDIYLINDRIRLESKDNPLVEVFLQSLLLNTSIALDEDYINLARICQQNELDNVFQHILLKFILTKFLEKQEFHQKSNNSENHFFTPGYTQERPMYENAERAIILLQNHFLQKDHQKVHRHEVLCFVKDFVDLTYLLNHKNKEQIKQKASGFERYRKTYHQILKLFDQMQKIDKVQYLSVYAIYYERLLRMYQITYLATNNISRLKYIRKELYKQVQDIRKMYTINTKHFGRLIAQLQK